MAKSEKGAVPIVLVLLVLAAIVGGGYYLASSGNLPVSVPGVSVMPRATEKDFSFIDDPLIRKHFAAQANVTAFRSKTHDLIGAAGSFNVFEVQIKGNDALFYNWHEDSGKKGGELISIGDTTYIKDYKDNAWWKQTLKPAAKPKNEDEGQREPQDFKDEYEKDRKLTYKKLGEEACPPAGGCYKYEEVDPKNPEAKRIFWFDKDKFLLRKEESGFGEWRGTTEYEYNAINIQPPSPTKDVHEGRNIYEYMGTGAPIPMPSFAPAESLETEQNLNIPTIEVPEGMSDEGQ